MQTHFWREILCLKHKRLSHHKHHSEISSAVTCSTNMQSYSSFGLYFAGMPWQVINALLPPNDISWDCPFPKTLFSYSTTRLKKKKNQVKLKAALGAEALRIPVVPWPLGNTGHHRLSSPVCKRPQSFSSFRQQQQNFIWVLSHKTIIVLWQLIFTGLQCTFLCTRDNAS